MFLQPGTNCYGLTSQRAFDEIVSRPNHFVCSLVLEEVPQHLSNVTKVCVGVEKRFPAAIVSDLLAEHIAHHLGNVAETHQVMSVVQGMALTDVTVIVRQEQAACTSPMSRGSMK